MNGRFPLDTNIVIVSFSGESGVVDRINDADEYFVSSTILGELFYGAFNSTNVNDNIGRIESFLANSGILLCTNAAMLPAVYRLLTDRGYAPPLIVTPEEVGFACKRAHGPLIRNSLCGQP